MIAVSAGADPTTNVDGAFFFGFMGIVSALVFASTILLKTIH